MNVIDFDDYYWSINSDSDYGAIKVELSFRPDIDSARRLVKVAETKTGREIPVTVTAESDCNWDKRTRHYLRVKGDFPYRTPLRLTIGAGLQCAGADKPKEGETYYPLMKDYTHEWKRPDEWSRVKFASSGRYLAPAGAKLVEFESMNNSNVAVRVAKVQSANIVELLALEEAFYGRIYTIYTYWHEESYVDDLATSLEKKKLPMANKTNESEKHVFSPAASNGVYFVELDGSEGGKAYKTVCITDIGLTVREDAKGAIVWAVSLSGGRPLAGARIEAYSSANALVASATTDAQGVARLASDKPRDRKNGIFAIVATAANGGDMSFIALGGKCKREDAIEDSWRREAFLGEKDLCAYAWTDRGIYRHGETIKYSALLRDAKQRAPASVPLELELVAPDGSVRDKAKVSSDDCGLLTCDAFSVGESQPGGIWKIRLSPPGEDSMPLDTLKVKIEEFAPPHIRVKAKAAEGRRAQEFSFEARAEHLYGAPAADLPCEGMVSFGDCDFAPGGEWKEWRFGDARRENISVFRRFKRSTLDGNGVHAFDAPFTTNDPPPRAAIRARVNATVFEDGGRPAYGKDAATLHFYSLYTGAKLPPTLPTGGEAASIPVALVAPDGKCAAGEPRKLAAKLERIDTICTYVEKPDGYASWKTERVRKTIAENIETAIGADGRGTLALPKIDDGDYALSIDAGDGIAAFSQTFYATSRKGDGEMRASLSTPDVVTVEPDKTKYAPGEKPTLAVRAPFAGVALVTVMREGVEYCRAVDFPSPTGTIVLDAVTAEQAPNLNVAIEVVQSVVKASGAKMAAKASGTATVRIAPPEYEIAVDAKAA